jgi:hypothetical protein
LKLPSFDSASGLSGIINNSTGGTAADAVQSNASPANPDPAKEVSFGEQSWDEMMIGFLRRRGAAE